MPDITPYEVLDLPMDQNDANAATVREYLASLLTVLWDENEGFSGKRPFGNSGWEHELYAALVKAGAVEADADGDLTDEARSVADHMIREAIATLGQPVEIDLAPDDIALRVKAAELATAKGCVDVVGSAEKLLAFFKAQVTSST